MKSMTLDIIRCLLFCQLVAPPTAWAYSASEGTDGTEGGVGDAIRDATTDRLYCSQAARGPVVTLPNATATLNSCGSYTITSTDIGQTAAGAGKIPVAGTGSKLDVNWLPVGTDSNSVASGTDARFTDARAPTGSIYAGTGIGFLTGTNTSTATSAALSSGPTVVSTSVETGTGTGNLVGTGTANYVAKFTAAQTLGNSQIADNGTSVCVNAATCPSGKQMEIDGAGSASPYIGQLALIDNRSYAQGVGGGIEFGGYYGTASMSPDMGYIKTSKVNGTNYDYSFDLLLGTRLNGNQPATVLTLKSTTDAVFARNISASNLVYAGNGILLNNGPTNTNTSTETSATIITTNTGTASGLTIGVNFGTAAGHVMAGDTTHLSGDVATTDSRLSDARTPTGNIYADTGLALKTGTATATATSAALSSSPKVVLTATHLSGDVPTSQVINSHTLTSTNITISAWDVGALNESQIGALDGYVTYATTSNGHRGLDAAARFSTTATAGNIPVADSAGTLDSWTTHWMSMVKGPADGLTTDSYGEYLIISRTIPAQAYNYNALITATSTVYVESDSLCGLYVHVTNNSGALLGTAYSSNTGTAGEFRSLATTTMHTVQLGASVTIALYLYVSGGTCKVNANNAFMTIHVAAY